MTLNLKNIFIAAYIAIGVIVGILIITDYSSCQYFQYGEKSGARSSAFDAGFGMAIGGAIWPIILPGMIAIYGDREGNYCLD